MRRLALALVLVSLAGCGIPVEDEARPLDIELESDIVDPGVEGGELPVIAEVYFVTGDRLVSVTRQIADSDPATVVRALLRGPIAAENGLSIRSAIPPETRELGASVTDGIATVDLSRDFTLVGGDEEILAVAQIVATVAALDEVDGVVFAIEGALRPAPVAEGQLVERPLVPADFTDLLTR